MNSPIGTWVNGERHSQLPLPDRALDYGDGLFETMLLWRGRILFQDEHWLRLQSGLQILGFPDCMDLAREHLASAVDAINQAGVMRCALRLTVSRGAGPRGYAPPDQARPHTIISATALPGNELTMAAPATLFEATMRWSTQPRLAGVKHLNRLEQVLAAGEARAAGCDEALMLDQEGSLISVAAGNLFLVAGTQLLTPKLDHCGIAGTRRRCVINNWAADLNLTVCENQVSMSQLSNADEVFYSNSILGVRPIASCSNLRWSAHPVCEALFDRYREAAA